MATEAAITRRGSVEGRDVAIWDGLLDPAQLGAYVEALDRAPFTHTEIAKPETAEHRHWVSEMALATLARLPIWPATERAIAALRPGIRHRPYRAYTNYAAYGDMLYTHTDCLPEANELTALWFLATRWEPEWGGETVFFDASGDAIFCASPRPGRLVMFDGAIRHAGRPPNRICFMPRYTFAIKLERVP